jgi:DNA-binding MarR family transcriptional regulator
MSSEIELLTEMRDLLQIMAEPAIAKRDARLRSSLRAVVGSSGKKAKAVQLMDGARSQSVIAKQVGIDTGNLSRLVKALSAAQLISADERSPKLLLKVPANFFDEQDADG